MVSFIIMFRVVLARVIASANGCDCKTGYSTLQTSRSCKRHAINIFT